MPIGKSALGDSVLDEELRRLFEYHCGIPKKDSGDLVSNIFEYVKWYKNRYYNGVNEPNPFITL